FAPAFEAKYGLPLERFFLIAVSMWSCYQGYANSSASPLLVDSEQHLVPHFGNDDVSRAMQLLAQTPEMLARNVAKSKNKHWIDDSSLLMEHPIIEVFPGKYTCPDI